MLFKTTSNKTAKITGESKAKFMFSIHFYITASTLGILGCVCLKYCGHGTG